MTFVIRLVNDMGKEKVAFGCEIGSDFFYFPFLAVLSDYFSLDDKLYQKQIKRQQNASKWANFAFYENKCAHIITMQAHSLNYLSQPFSVVPTVNKKGRLIKLLKLK